MQPRLVTVATVSGFAVASAALTAYLLFIDRRNLVTTGDAHLQTWVNPETARWLYLGIVLALAAAFTLTAVLGTRATSGAARAPGVTDPDAPAVQARSWRLGAGTGAAAGAVVALVTVITGATATRVAVLTAPVMIAYLAALVGPALGGGWAARSTGRTGSGAIAGLWFGASLALVAGFALVLRDTVFADRLVSGAWLLDHFGDQTCNGQSGDTLAACEIGDSLGAMASEWLLFPLVGAGLGALGGLVGRTIAGARQGVPERGLTALAPAVLGVFLAVVFAAEVSFKLW